MTGFNHYPWCTCGWCSGGYRGGRGSGGWSSPPVSRHTSADLKALATPTHWAWTATPEFRTLDSYTVPNARCPKCGAPVFFYKSPANGRVFFDSLGPPWPKHPCMDSEEHRNAVTGAVPLWTGARSDSQSPWLRQGWRPFFVDQCQPLTMIPDGWHLWGSRNGEALDLYVIGPEWSKAALIQARRLDSRSFRLSASVLADDGDMHEIEDPAYQNMSDLLNGRAPRAPALQVSPHLSAAERQPKIIGGTDGQSRLVQHAHNVQASLGWRPFVVKSIDPIAGVTNGWRMAGSWFQVKKTLHLCAQGWDSATQIFARREDDNRFSVSARIRGADGAEETVILDAFERRESIEAAAASPELEFAADIDKHLKAEGSSSALLLLVGRRSTFVLQTLASRLSTQAVRVDAAFGAAPAEQSAHTRLLDWAVGVRRDGPLLLDGAQWLRQMAKSINPLWVLGVISLGTQVVAVWPGEFGAGVLTLATDAGELSYSAANIAVWVVD